MNRLLLEQSELDGAGQVRVADYRADHLRNVLGVTPGREVRVGVVNGPRGVGVVREIGETAITLECRLEQEIPPVPPVDLVLAVPRPKVLRRLWAPLASVGVGRIFLTNAEKVERPYFDTHWLEPSVYRQELIHGLEQAGDTRLPEVRVCRRLKPFIQDEADALFEGQLRLLAHPAPEPSGFRRIAGSGRQVVAIGPEGGWTAFELELFHQRSFQPLSLGTRTLRVDTACIVIIGLLHALRG